VNAGVARVGVGVGVGVGDGAGASAVAGGGVSVVMGAETVDGIEEPAKLLAVIVKV
jgi:hypothetical protein